MKIRKVSISILLALFGVFVGTLFYAAAELPERVASHFGRNGEPNGWMSKQAVLVFLGIIGFGVPLFIVGVCYMTRYLPKGMVNLPHRDYWLAPERRSETTQYLFGHSLWFASMLVALLTWVHLLVVFANKQSSPTLSTSLLFAGMACFFAGSGIWAWRLFRHFRHPSAPS